MIWLFRKPRLTVLMVCTANVCRSPAAEALLRHHLKQRGLARSVAVTSAGTDVAAPGRRPDPRVLAILDEMGVKSRGMRAQPLTDVDVARSDIIFVMEQSHRLAVLERFADAEQRVSLLDPDGHDIADPYFGSKAGVRTAVEAIDALVRRHAAALSVP